MALQSNPIHRSGNRDNLFMGGDREAVMLIGLIAGVLVLTTHEWPALTFGAVLWFGGLYGLRQAAKYDPKLRHVLERHFFRYRRFYPPRATPFRINP